MSYVLTSYEIAIGTWLTTILPAAYANRVFASDQRGARLNAPYATFKVVSDTPVAATARTRTRADDTQEVESSRKMLVSVNVVGPDAYAHLVEACVKYEALALVQALAATGLTCAHASAIRRLSSETLAAREERAQVDFLFYRVATATVAQPTIAEIVGELET